MSSVIAGIIEGFFGRVLSRFSTEDLQFYIDRDLNLIEYTQFDQHTGTYNSVVPLLNQIRRSSVTIIVPLIREFFTTERILYVIATIPGKGKAWIDILADKEHPRGYRWLKRNINEIRDWATRFFADPNFYKQPPLQYRPDNGGNDPIDKRFGEHS